MRKLAFVFVLLFLAACTEMGHEVSQQQLTQLKKGQTTVEQAIALLGPPTSRSVMPDGSMTLSYMFMKTQTRPESFIPYVGALVGGSDSYNSMTLLNFDDKGVFKNYYLNEGGSAMTSGLLNTGSMRARQANPTEAK